MEYSYDPSTSTMYTLNINGKYDSINDNPAIVHINHNTKIWMNNGKLDRDHKKGPAILSKFGNKSKEIYLKNGKLHNPNGIAFKYGKENKYYYNGIEYDELKLNDEGQIHGYQYANINDKKVKELWAYGEKIDFINLPVIVNKYDDDIIIFGYDYNFEDNIHKILRNNKCKVKKINIYSDDASMINLKKYDDKYYLGHFEIHYDELIDIVNKRIDEKNINGYEYI